MLLITTDIGNSGDKIILAGERGLMAKLDKQTVYNLVIIYNYKWFYQLLINMAVKLKIDKYECEVEMR